MITSRSVLLRMRNVSDKIVEKMKRHISYSVTIFGNRAVYEIVVYVGMGLDLNQILYR